MKRVEDHDPAICCCDFHLALRSALPRCRDCGAVGVLTGHMECQYPQDRP